MRAAERIVVDTNTFVSGILLPDSVPGRLLAHLVEHLTLIVIIAAHAPSLTLTLATNNRREFARVAGLRPENWIPG